MVAHGRDAVELTRFAQRTHRHRRVAAAVIEMLEPDLGGRFDKGLYFADEAHLDPRAALVLLARRVELQSRLMLGTARFPSPAMLLEAIKAARAEVVTVSLRRESSGERAGQGFWSLIRDSGVRVLPNTAGCHSAKEAVITAHMAREVFGTAWIKLEVIGEDNTLQPDVFGLVEAARILCAEAFEVFPYTTEDLVVAEKLLSAGCRVLMPWGSPIGSGLGLNNLFGLKALRAQFPNVPLVIDAGIGRPSHAAQAMELGFDAALVNTAVAEAADPVAMAAAFAQATQAGRAAYRAGLMEPREIATPSTPVVGKAFSLD